MISRSAAEQPVAAARAVDAAVTALIKRQKTDGHWHEGLGNKVSVDAHHLLLYTFLGLAVPGTSRASANWIKSGQSAQGGWPNFAGGPDQVSTSVMAYLALRVAGDLPGEPHMEAAAARIRQLGGLQACGASARLWLALFGLWPWHDVPAFPPEVILLPTWAPICLDDFAVWARSALLSVAVIAAHRPVRTVEIDLAELSIAGPDAPGTRHTGAARFLSAFQRRFPPWLRRRAYQRIRCRLLERQDDDGCWGGIHAPTVYCLLALSLLGEPIDGPVLTRALAGLETFLQVEEDGRVSVRFSHAEVWDTALAVQALQASNSPAAHEAVRHGTSWLTDRQLATDGEWSSHRPGLVAGGWAFENGNRHCPDTDDTAMVLRTLLSGRSDASPPNAPGLDEICHRGLDWLAGMAGHDGGWAAFDADARVDRIRRLMGSRAGAYIDPPTPDVTAHAVETLAHAGAAYRDAVCGGVRWLRSAQEPDGSWYGRWGCNHIYGTAAALTALTAAGVRADDLAVRRGAAWLVGCQNSDGGWGEDHRSYQDPCWRGRGSSAPSQTAWALSGLLSADDHGEHIERGIAWLLRRQTPSGLWQETQFTGTGFPWESPIRYGSYPMVFPIAALAAYVAAAQTPHRSGTTKSQASRVFPMRTARWLDRGSL